MWQVKKKLRFLPKKEAKIGMYGTPISEKKKLKEWLLFESSSPASAWTTWDITFSYALLHLGFIWIK